MMSKFLSSTLLVVALAVLGACSTYPPLQVQGAPEYSDSEYSALFANNTQSAEQYKGLANTMAVRATLITPKLAEAILARKARIYQWDQAKYDEELEELRANLAKEVHFFVSLYTAEPKLDDLIRKKDEWSILLETGSERYAGVPKKISGEFVEIEPIYPSHNRFGRAYIIEFPLGTDTLSDDAKFILTGPLDSAVLDFDVDQL